MKRYEQGYQNQYNPGYQTNWANYGGGYGAEGPRCCCGCTDAVTGSIVIGVLQLVFSGGFAGIGFYATERGLQFSVGPILFVVFTIMMIVGAAQRNGCLMAPYLISQIIRLILFCLGMVLFAIIAAYLFMGKELFVNIQTHGMALDSVKWVMLVVTFIIAGLFALEIYFTMVVYKAYKYIQGALY